MPGEQELNLIELPDVALPSYFEVKSLIGRGAYGSVYLVHDSRFERNVAIKVLNFDSTTDSELYERFQREAKLLASLDNPHIVRVLSWGVDAQGHAYTVMELVEGKPLSEELGEGIRLAPSQFYEIFSQILRGLTCIHENGIVHRDLKPSNIMICGNDGKTNVKIIDFGIARLVENSDLGGHTLTRTNSVFGSPAYMSPEQCRGAKVDHLSDIYSCACIMFEALNGVPPLVGATSIETMYKHMSEVPPSMRLQATDERGNKLGQLIDSCLEKEPSARPQSAAEVLACLDELFSERLDTGSLFSSEMKRQSSKPQYGIFMLLAILVVVGIGIWSLQINRAKNSVVLEQISSANKSEKIHRMEELERDLQRSEKYYQRAQNSAEKLVFAERIFEQSRELAMAQRGCSEFGTAEANLSQALALAKVSGGARTHHCSDLYNALIDCLIQDNKIQRAEELLAEFKKLEGLTGEARARQVLLRMKIECKTHNLEPMFEQFSSMVEFCGDRISANQHFSSFTKTHIDPLSVRMADELWRMIAKEHFESPGEILLAAKMGIAVAKLEVEKQCPIAASRSLHGAASFLKQLNKSLKGYAEAAQQLNKLAEQSGIEL